MRVTEKNIQVHVTVDGANDVYSQVMTISHRNLLKLGAKKRIRKGITSYFLEVDYYIYF